MSRLPAYTVTAILTVGGTAAYCDPGGVVAEVCDQVESPAEGFHLTRDDVQGGRSRRARSGTPPRRRPLAPIAHFAGQGEWADPGGTLVIAEITSYDRDTRETVVHSEPADGKYRAVRSHAFGAAFEIADLGITLETEILKQYVR